MVRTNDYILPVYFQESYSTTQDYINLIKVESEDFFIAVDVDGPIAQSVPASPFGSVFQKNKSARTLPEFLHEVESKLRRMGCEELQITCPPDCYDRIVPVADLIKFGYQPILEDICQVIRLDGTNQIHPMESRKLKSLNEDPEIEILHTNDFERLHDFLSDCRQEQGLRINISMEKLHLLKTRFPTAYEGFVVTKKNKWISAVIMVEVDPQTWYYYLPGTPKRFKSVSPMVRLLDALCLEGRKRKFRFLDLGVSSILGKKQKGLFEFKERMGAYAVPKLTLCKSL